MITRKQNLRNVWNASGNTVTNTTIVFSFNLSLLRRTVELNPTFGGVVDITIDWGDGTPPYVATTSNPSYTHTYTSPFGSGVVKQVVMTISDPSKLTALSFQSTGYVGAFPPNIQYYNNIGLLNLNGPNFDFIPARIGKITGLRQLNMTSITSLDGKIPEFVFASAVDKLLIQQQVFDSDNSVSNFDRIGEMPQLVRLLLNGPASGSPSEITDLPSGMASLTSLANLGLNGNTQLREDFPTYYTWFKDIPLYSTASFAEMTLSGCFLTSIRVDAFVDSFYTLVTTEANISTGSYWRNGKLKIGTHGSFVNASPTGTYAAPAGFSLGVSNGTPANQKEKLYVLVNQYGWTITYN